MPVESVPCLNYRRELDKEAEVTKKKEQEQNGEASASQNGQRLPKATVECLGDKEATSTLQPTQLQDYCEKLFKFRKIHIPKFK